MRTVRTGGRDVEISAGALTPLAWHRAFGGDGLFDAAVRLQDYYAASRMQAETAAEEGASPHYVEGFPALDVTRLVYAMAWTADYAAGRATESFEAWLLSLGEVNMYEIAGEVSAEILAGLFRTQ